jgi:hypothetical protein
MTLKKHQQFRIRRVSFLHKQFNFSLFIWISVVVFPFTFYPWNYLQCRNLAVDLLIKFRHVLCSCNLQQNLSKRKKFWKEIIMPIFLKKFDLRSEDSRTHTFIIVWCSNTFICLISIIPISTALNLLDEASTILALAMLHFWNLTSCV